MFFNDLKLFYSDLKLFPAGLKLVFGDFKLLYRELDELILFFSAFTPVIEGPNRFTMAVLRRFETVLDKLNCSSMLELNSIFYRFGIVVLCELFGLTSYLYLLCIPDTFLRYLLGGNTYLMHVSGIRNGILSYRQRFM